MGGTRRGHGYFKGAAMKAMAGAAALLVGTALMGSAALAGGEPPPEPPTTEPPTTLAPEDPPVPAGDPPVQAGDPPVQVAAINGFSKEFNPATIAPGDTSTLTFTITVDALGATGLDFTDTLPPEVTVATTPTASQCGGTVTETPSGTIDFTGGEIAAGTPSCTIEVEVTSSTPGTHDNTATGTSDPMATPFPEPATAILTVTPGFTKVFVPAQIAVAGVTTLTYTINNTGNTAGVTDLGFTDNLPTGLTVAPTPNATTTCTPGGTVTAAAGSTTISLATGSVAADSSCTVSVNVTASTAGTYTSTSGALTSSLGTDGTATATLTVTAAVTATPVATPSTPGATLAATGVSTTTLLTAIGVFVLLFGALLVYGSSQRRRLLRH